jgi:mannose-1-phosphate guanylyltransferase/mannose-6-phosphate isomerase
MDAVVDLGKFRALGPTQITPVILSGGSGTRLWPLSRALYPKQLLPLVSEQTMFQETVARGLSDTGFSSPVVICNEEHRFIVDEQLRALGVQPAGVLLEPVGRNTGPAVAAAAFWLAAKDPNAMMLVEPSDHLIAAPAEFHRGVAKGVMAAQNGKLVTFGVKPTRPETGYGYIQVQSAGEGGGDITTVERFVEKPDHETAQRFVASGLFYWNSGIFLLSARHYLDELQRLHPAMFDACKRAVEGGKEDLGFFRLQAAAFGEAPSLSVDRAVMEHTDRAAVVAVDMSWNDIGSWEALRVVGSPDQDGNVVHGDVVLEGVRNSYIRSESKLVVGIGVDDVVVVATDDAVLVARADKAAAVSRVVEQLSQRNRTEPLQHPTNYRPWGYYRSIDVGDRYQVKRIMVKPKAKLSLQKHFHRAEHWIVVCGTALVQRGQETMLLHENESIDIPVGTEHRLENPGLLPLHIIEVQSGAYLGEDDIVRLSDSYGRA